MRRITPSLSLPHRTHPSSHSQHACFTPPPGECILFGFGTRCEHLRTRETHTNGARTTHTVSNHHVRHTAFDTRIAKDNFSHSRVSHRDKVTVHRSCVAFSPARLFILPGLFRHRSEKPGPTKGYERLSCPIIPSLPHLALPANTRIRVSCAGLF